MWGVTARLMPYLELGTFYNAVNFTLKVCDPSNTTVVSSTLKVLICPSEANPQPYMSTSSTGATTVTGVTNYGWCEGDWYVYGGVGGPLNRSAFAVNASRSFAAITDGLSQTVVIAIDGKAQRGAAGAPSVARPCTWSAPGPSRIV